MGRESPLATAMLVRLQEVTNRTFVLAWVSFSPTSRCNSRCMSCDWWKQSGAGDLTLEEIEGVAASLPALGTRVVVFSGGEPLLRPEVFEAAGMFRARGIRLHLLTSGVLLERCAESAAEHFARVIVSLRARPPDAGCLALDPAEIAEFESLVEQTIEEHRGDFESGFVTDSPDKLRRLPQYYAALAGRAPFPPVACNAPWMSVVIEADGAVRPCFFHEAVGNIRRAPVR